MSRKDFKPVEKRTLVKIGGSFRLTIPAYMVRSMGWKVGDGLTISATTKALSVKKE